MKNVFNSISIKRPQSNHFDMSHDRKFSLDMGKLVPIHCQEVLPGDKINLKSTQLLRMAPLVAPVMHYIDVYTHFFFVPNRLLWSNWEQFITGGDDGLSDPTFPVVYITGSNEIGSIPDYLGVPTGSLTTPNIVTLSALPLAAYGLIYNEYYRDQNLQEPIDITLLDGDNTGLINAAGLMGVPFNRAWEHDYFTSSLPFAQKGPGVILPLGNNAPISYIPGHEARINDLTGNPIAASQDVETSSSGGQYVSGASINSIDNSDSLQVDLTGATSSTINDLRVAFRLQEWLEKNARGGTRYIENILVHFGVRTSDARLQRPEYLGGGKSPVSISEVLQTSESIETPQGNLAGHGVNVGQSHQFSRRFEEHGYIIGIMSVMPRTAYSQGLPKHWTKFDKFDYYWPTFAHLGEQEVKNQEICLTGDAAYDDGTFGYVPRYSEYRYLPSSVHGDFRETLEYWHMGRKFDPLVPPALNADFIKCQPTDRIFAVQDLPDSGGDPDQPLKNFHKLYAHVYHDIQATRPIPKYGTPFF